jgi:hypothetical protein
MSVFVMMSVNPYHTKKMIAKFPMDAPLKGSWNIIGFISKKRRKKRMDTTKSSTFWEGVNI